MKTMCDTLNKPELKQMIMENIFKEFSKRFTETAKKISEWVDTISKKDNKAKFDDGIKFIERIDKIRLEFKNIEKHDVIKGKEKDLTNAITSIVEQTLNFQIEFCKNDENKKAFTSMKKELKTDITQFYLGLRFTNTHLLSHQKDADLK